MHQALDVRLYQDQLSSLRYLFDCMSAPQVFQAFVAFLVHEFSDFGLRK